MKRFKMITVMLALFFSTAALGGGDGIGLESWGVRIGLGTDPDQVIGGVQFDLGELVDRLRFEPNIELGVGDDHTILSATGPVHYLFDVDSRVAPFAGGGVTAAYIDRDDRRGDDSDVDIALKLIGGVDWPLRSDRRFRLEFNLVIGDVHDAQIMAGWAF